MTGSRTYPATPAHPTGREAAPGPWNHSASRTRRTAAGHVLGFAYLLRPTGVAMTVKTKDAARERTASKAPARNSARTRTKERLSRADQVARGRDARALAPLESHAEFTPDKSRDPVGLLLEQEKIRVPELVPVRHGRMLVSPFTFYRGAALPMAAD